MRGPGEKLSTEEAETSIGFLLRRASQRCKEVTVPVLKRNGLSPHELTTLNMIHINDSCILRTLSEGVGVESPAMNRIMNSLEKKKLVCRQKDSRDMRYTYFTLTRAGVELVEKATPEVQEVEDKVLLALTEDERKQLFSSLRKLL